MWILGPAADLYSRGSITFTDSEAAPSIITAGQANRHVLEWAALVNVTERLNSDESSKWDFIYKPEEELLLFLSSVFEFHAATPLVL